MIRDSLTEVGPFRSIATDGEGVIRCGNGVFEQASALGLKIRDVIAESDELINVVRPDLVGEKAVRAALLDNRTAELAIWNTDVLAELNQEIDLTDLWDAEELADLIGGSQKETGNGGDDFDATPDEDGPTRCNAGELWKLGEHRLMVGDCRDAGTVSRLMAGRKADAVITDPPYGISRDGIANDDEAGLSGLLTDALKLFPIKNAVVIAFQSTRLFPAWLDAVREAGHNFERMLWLYKPADCTFPWRGWILTSESILVSTVGDGQWNDVHPFAHDCYSPTTICKEMDKETGWHPTIKPLPVVMDLMNRSSRDGGTIYDPFLGSGTTLVAAERLGRRCYGCEISPRYADVILKRWEAETGGTVERLEDAG